MKIMQTYLIVAAFVLPASMTFADTMPTSDVKTSTSTPVLGQVVIPLDVKFDTGKSDLKVTQVAETGFQKAVQELKNYPYAKLEVEGYTDSTGSQAINQKLSADRALAIRKYFIDRYNVAPERITAKAFSDKRPEATNATVEGRSENRRAVARIIRLETNEAAQGGRSL